MNGKIKATKPATPVLNGKWNDGEQIAGVVVIDASDGREVARARVWMGRSRNASRVYAGVWTSGAEGSSGYGWAAGGGYDKKSAAIAAAIRSAGYTLDADIDGRGMARATDALVAIAAAHGHRRVYAVDF